MFSETFFDASYASLLLAPITKLSKDLFWSMRLNWMKESLMKEIFVFRLFSFFWKFSIVFSAILNSILIISFLDFLITFNIWSKYLETIQSLINLVDTETKI